MSDYRKAAIVRSILSTTIFLLLIAFNAFFMINLNLLASDAEVQEFIDLDGDGFNDLLQNLSSAASPKSAPDDIFTLGNQVAPAPELRELNSSGFDQHLFSARALRGNRCSLDSDVGFGPGNGIGSGIILSGCCEGGVCRPF